ncbi:hypothetical protein RRF57_011550 [Xylaria bambusicola]|uniref:Mitochondrial division protein 1 n=1 Tax=Xylaria bambusicola TaxID=326684 RepID=A0AAN7UYC0_9PEZI
MTHTYLTHNPETLKPKLSTPHYFTLYPSTLGEDILVYKIYIIIKHEGARDNQTVPIDPCHGKTTPLTCEGLTVLIWHTHFSATIPQSGLVSAMDPKDNSKSRLKKIKKFFRQPRTGPAAQSTTPSRENDQSTEQGSTQHESETPPITTPNTPVFRSVVDPQATRPSTESNPASQDQPIIVPQALYLATSTESLHKDSIESSNPTISVSEELWNTAYDELKEAEAELVGSYMKILKKFLGDQNGDPTAEDHLDQMNNLLERPEYMRELVKRGKERVEKASKIATKVSSVANFILSSRGIIDFTLKAVPQAAPAALPWAGVCLGLEMLQNPGQQTNSNLEGIAHVISRMDWYCALTKMLLNESNITDGINFQPILSQLKKNIIELYKALLLFQMKSIVSYYRNQGVRFLRDLGKLDDWEGNIRRVKDVETALQKDMDQYYQEQTKTHLNELSHNAYTLTAHLGNIQQDIRGFILEQKAKNRDRDDAECRRELRVVDPQDDMMRIEKNKDPLLDDSYRWIFDTPEYKAFSNWENGGAGSPQRRVLWLKGHAGTGKTMLMIGVIRELSSQPVALTPSISYFFCQGTNSELRTATAVLRSLIWLLLLQQPYLMEQHLLPKYKISGPNLFTDLNSFIALSEVFKNMLKDDQLSPVYLAVDALDECSEGREDLITLISTTFTLSRNVKWLLSGRPEVDLSKLKTAEALIELDTQRLERPVKAYIQHKLDLLDRRAGYNDKILKEISDIVYEKAENTFLWVALAFKTLGKKHARYAVKVMSQMPHGLADLYEHMMSRIEKSVKLEPSDCKKVLKAVFLAFRPLFVSELSTLTDLESDIIHDAVEECGSFVAKTDEIVNLIHQSARDYLKDIYDPKRDRDWVALRHAHLIEHSLHAISSLERNIYGLEFDTNATDITPPALDPLAELQYSCVFWIEHLFRSKSEQPDCFRDLMATVHEFLKTGFLRWIESLSLLGKVEDGVRALKELVRLVEAEPDMDPSLVEFVEDAYTFLSRHISIIQETPLQIYGSALVFGPTMSKVREQYWEERLPLVDIKLGFKDHWTNHLILEGHTSAVKAVAFSPSSKILASAAYESEVRLYDAATGAGRQTLNLQADHCIRAIVFSPGGETLAIGVESYIQLWDVATNEYRPALRGHSGDVTAVAFSLDGRTLASASEDKTIRLWDLQRMTCYLTLMGHKDSVIAIAFTPNNLTLVSGSYDETIRFWDVRTGECQQTIELHEYDVLTLAVSPDGNTLAIGSSLFARDTMSLWNVVDGTLIQGFGGHSRSIGSVVFSPDGKIIASASDKSVRLWDITSTPLRCKTLEGHIAEVNAVAFSPDGKMLVSASDDQTVRLWDMTAPSAISDLPEERSRIMGVTISPNGEILASISWSGSLQLWDVATTRLVNEVTGEYDIGSYLGVWVRQPNLDDFIFSPNGRMVAMAWSTEVQLWSIATTPPTVSTFKSKGPSRLTFSPDTRMLGLSTYKGKVELWDLTTSSPEPRHTSLLAEVTRIVFSSDSKMLGLATHDCKVELWDLTTSPEVRLLGITRDIGRALSDIVFSPDNSKFAVATYNKGVELWDLTIALQESIKILTGNVFKLVFSPNSQILQTISATGSMVQQWDVATGSPLPSEHHRNENLEYDISADVSWITLDGKRVLWLPAEYRPCYHLSAAATHGSTVAIAAGAEKLVVMKFI